MLLTLLDGNNVETFMLTYLVQRLAYVPSFQIGESLEDLRLSYPISDHADNCGNGNTHPTDAGDTNHLPWIGCNSCESHVLHFPSYGMGYGRRIDYKQLE